jgi:hypothetical protein
MQSSRDSSLWRSLAVAFGDGLAFAVGMKLTQAASRQMSAPQAAAPTRSDRSPLTDRAGQIEQDVERVERAPMAASNAVGQKVIEAIILAVEARLSEHSGQVEHRLADLEARTEDIGTLRQEMVGLHREFGEAVARIVAEQVSSQVEARAAELRESLRQEIAAAVEMAVAAAAEARLPAAVSACLQPLEQQLRAELHEKNREIAELRQRITDTDANVLELIQGIGRICRQSAERVAPPVALAEPGGTVSRPAPLAVNQAVDQISDSPASGRGDAEVADTDLIASGLVLPHY